MKVKTSSWHYRLWRFGRESHSRPKDLCRYFWHLLLIKILLPAALAGLVLFGIGALLWLIWGHPLETAGVVFSALLAIGFGVGLYFLIQWLVERHREKAQERRKHPKPEKEPSVLFQYLAARKRKVCPLIEVIDDADGVYVIESPD